MLTLSALVGLLISVGGDGMRLLPALLLGLAWAAWALPRPDRVLKTMFLLTPVVNPGVPWGPFDIYLSSGLILVAGLSTAMSAFFATGDHAANRDWLRHRLVVPLFLLVIVNLLSMTFNSGVPLSEGVRVILLLLQLYVVAFIVYYVATDEARAASLLPWLLVGGSLGAAAALVSAIQPGFAPWSLLGGVKGANASFGAMSQRIEGAFLHPNNLGIFVAYLIVAQIALVAYFKKSSTLLWAGGAIALVTLLLTLSRGAWLGAVAGVGTVFLLQRRAPVSAIVVAALGLIVFSLLFSHASDVNDALSQRITQVTPSSLAQRQGVWGQNIQAFVGHPILGAGPGATRSASSDAHSSYLQVLVDTGIVGAVVYVALLLAVGRELFGALKRSRGTRRYHIAVAAAGVWAAFMASGLVHSSDVQVFSNWFPGLMLGLAMAINRLPNPLARPQGGAAPDEAS
jgi:O-antigen ligase